MDYFSQVNAPILYLIVGGILLFISVMCVVFMVRSYKAGIAIGMDRKVLKKTMTSSIIFTVLPSVGILVGVITLSGSLGIPLSWLRLSVIGALQYELTVAEMAAEAIGLTGLKISELSIGAYTTIALVMSVGILGGAVCSIFFLKKYLGKVNRKKTSPKAEEQAVLGNSGVHKKHNFGTVAMVAMFIGLCAAYIGSYIGEAAEVKNFMPLFTAAMAAAFMLIFELLRIKKKMEWLDNFSVACSMLLAMASVIVLNQVI